MSSYRCLDKGFVLWFTGLPGSGKTTIAGRVAEILKNKGYRVELIDGDWARKTVSVGSGFTREERMIHLKRIAWIARLLARNGVIVLCSFVSPYREARKMIRGIVEEETPFIEIYVNCPLEECIKRDPKGLYKKALKGEIKHFTGITDPYEPPENPDLILNTHIETIEESVDKVVKLLREKLGIDL